MLVFKSIKNGIQIVRQYWQVLAIFYILNFIFAAVLSVPMRSLLMNFFGNRLASKIIADGFNIAFFAEFISKSGESVGVIITLVTYFSVLYFFLNTFLIGGVLANYQQRDSRYSTTTFFQGCIDYFWRFFRLFLLFLLIALVLILLNLLLSGLLKLVFGEVRNESVWLKTRIGKWVFLLLLFLIANMIFDYAKILIVQHDIGTAKQALVRAFIFVRTNSGKALALYGLIFLSGIVLLIVYWLLSDFINPGSMLPLALLLCLQQLYIIARIGVKLVFYSAQLDFYQASRHNDFGDKTGMPNI
ncbi:hypothetical protein JXJ21_24010 [candidate division KSB1 bacterium]|nr:hypothetical protein [candidate division KSB1 bacterium]